MNKTVKRQNVESECVCDAGRYSSDDLERILGIAPEISQKLVAEVGNGVSLNGRELRLYVEANSTVVAAAAT